MKFNCGETWAEYLERLSNWHLFFCLLPCKVADHDCRWLEVIERRGEWIDKGPDFRYWIWYYRAITNKKE